MMVVDDTTLKEAAGTPPKLTAVAPVKLVPVMTMVESVPAVVGLNEVMVGGVTKVNPPVLPVPFLSAVMTIFPDDPEPTTALMVVADWSINDFAGVPPKLTAVTNEKPVPVMTTVSPVVAVVGINEVMTGVMGPL